MSKQLKQNTIQYNEQHNELKSIYPMVEYTSNDEIIKEVDPFKPNKNLDRTQRMFYDKNSPLKIRQKA